VNHGNAA